MASGIFGAPQLHVVSRKSDYAIVVRDGKDQITLLSRAKGGTTYFPLLAADRLTCAEFRLTGNGALNGKFLSCDLNGKGSWVDGVTPTSVTKTLLRGFMDGADRTNPSKVTVRLMKFNNVVFCHISCVGSLGTGNNPDELRIQQATGNDAVGDIIPAGYRPAVNARLPIVYLDDEAVEVGYVYIGATSGAMTIINTIAAANVNFTINAHISWAVGMN